MLTMGNGEQKNNFLLKVSKCHRAAFFGSPFFWSKNDRYKKSCCK